MDRDQISNQAYLKESQYKTPENLRARMQLHERFNTNSYPWFAWVFDHFNLQPGMQVLEIGCGPAGLWQRNSHRVPEGVRPILGDLSIGMVQEARQALAGRHFSFFNLDAQAIPVTTESLDLIIANHMLYHVPDIDRAVAEIARVLKPGGLLVAATNGIQHMKELRELVAGFAPDSQEGSAAKRFSLENGSLWLQPHFSEVEVGYYDSNLMVTEPQPLIDYVRSMWPLKEPPDSALVAEFSAFVHRRFAAQNPFPITKAQGLFLAKK